MPDIDTERETIDDRVTSLRRVTISDSIDDLIVESDCVGADRRDAFRIRQSGDHSLGLMRVGSKRFEVEIIDESSGGFMICADRVPRSCVAGATAELISISGRQPVQIIWAHSDNGMMRFGLQRDNSIEEWRPESPWLIWMVLAVIFGFAAGFFFVFQSEAAWIDQIADLVNGGRVVNSFAD